MSVDLVPVARDNGKLYRPRKPPEVVEFSSSCDDTGVMVRFTHDIDRARALAMPLLVEYELEGVHPSLRWYRVVPWDTSGHGWDYTYVEDAVRGTPCVVWDPADL